MQETVLRTRTRFLLPSCLKLLLLLDRCDVTGGTVAADYMANSSERWNFGKIRQLDRIWGPLGL